MDSSVGVVPFSCAASAASSLPDHRGEAVALALRQLALRQLPLAADGRDRSYPRESSILWISASENPSWRHTRIS
jgi:hypothetical protein